MDPRGPDGPWRAAERRIRHAWIAAMAHAVGSSTILLATGVNIVLAAHYPLVSAVAILALGAGVRRRSRVAALLLAAAALTPALIKLVLGVLHLADLPAFLLGGLYLRGFVGTLQHRRLASPSAAGRRPDRRS